jgi:hypothetical protein
VAAAVLARWPNAVVKEEHSMPGRTSLYFHFEHDGRIRIGSFFNTPGETLVVDGADADALPEIVAWFLGLTPPDVSNVTYTPYTPEPIPVPPHADEKTLREVYRPLLE